MDASFMRRGLTANQLKLLALLSMTCDHIGLMLLPQLRLLRIVGRLAFPIFAFMISEGCRYTAHRARYLCTVLIEGLLCQIVFFFADHSLYQCILITFSLSICLIYCLRWAREAGKGRWLLCFGATALVFFICRGLPHLLPATDFAIDYGFTGVLLPVLIFCANDRWEKLAVTGIGLVLVSLEIGSAIQWYSLAALLPLLLYRGARGKRKLKYLFYIYYPAHLAAIWLIGLLL